MSWDYYEEGITFEISKKEAPKKKIDIVATATKLRKEYELLYRQLRDLVYPQKKRDD